jgi:hypothetical protein
LLGRGGDGVGGGQYGIVMSGGAVVSGGIIGGQVTLNGRGGASTGNGNVGVRVVGTGTSITSFGAPVQVIGLGDGAGTTAQHHGVQISGGASVASGGAGTLTITGTGGTSTGGGHHGVQLVGATITSGGGNVQVTGVAGLGGLGGGIDVNIAADPGTVLSTATNGGSITLAGDNLVLGSNVSTNFSNSVTLRPTTANLNWDLGVVLPDAELDLITTATLNIGSATMGSSTDHPPGPHGGQSHHWRLDSIHHGKPRHQRRRRESGGRHVRFARGRRSRRPHRHRRSHVRREHRPPDYHQRHHARYPTSAA